MDDLAYRREEGQPTLNRKEKKYMDSLVYRRG
jgi:hypothetical protein